MEVVREVIEDELHLNIPIAGLAKDNRHRTSELLFGFPPQTIGIKQHSPLFRILTQIQDEVHRFAISFHRDKRSKRQVASALDTIKGIGEKTKTALLKEFKSVKTNQRGLIRGYCCRCRRSQSKNSQRRIIIFSSQYTVFSS